jgi:hypothetical protein
VRRFWPESFGVFPAPIQKMLPIIKRQHFFEQETELTVTLSWLHQTLLTDFIFGTHAYKARFSTAIGEPGTMKLSTENQESV